MPCLEFGCSFTWPYFLIGATGGLTAVLVLPGCYVTMPSKRKVHGQTRYYLGVFGRLIVSGIFACVVDTNNKNAFFAGFFAWHVLTWASEGGWGLLKQRLEALFNRREES